MNQSILELRSYRPLIRHALFALSLVCISIFKAYAQTSVDSMMMVDTSMEEAINKCSSPLSSQKKHQLYLNVHWQHSAITTKDGDIVYFNGRFNVLDKSIEVMKHKKVRTIRPDRVVAAQIGDRFFTVVPQAIIKGRLNTSFFEVLSSGKVNLYKLHLVKSRVTGSNSITTAFNGEKEYYLADELYVHPEYDLCRPLKGKKKVLRLFGDKKNEVDAYRKFEKLKYRNERDLTQIFNFYNTLAKE